MKVSIYASIFAAATSFVAAQNINISDVPSCALPCVMSSSPEGCGAADYACWCSSNTWLSSLATCVRPACPSEADQAQLVSLAQGLCSTYSVTISSDILASATPTPSGSNSTSNRTASATATPTGGASASETSTGAAERIMAGSGLMAAAAGVAMLVL